MSAVQDTQNVTAKLELTDATQRTIVLPTSDALLISCAVHVVTAMTDIVQHPELRVVRLYSHGNLMSSSAFDVCFNDFGVHGCTLRKHGSALIVPWHPDPLDSATFSELNTRKGDSSPSFLCKYSTKKRQPAHTIYRHLPCTITRARRSPLQLGEKVQVPLLPLSLLDYENPLGKVDLFQTPFWFHPYRSATLPPKWLNASVVCSTNVPRLRFPCRILIIPALCICSYIDSLVIPLFDDAAQTPSLHRTDAVPCVHAFAH